MQPAYPAQLGLKLGTARPGLQPCRIDCGDAFVVQLNLIANHPFMRGLPGSAQKQLAKLAKEVRFASDEVVFRAGEKSRDFYLVLSGSVCVEVSTPVYSLCIQSVGAGGAFGWSSLLGEHGTAFQVRSREDGTVAVRWNAEELLAVCEQDPKLCSMIFRRVATLIGERVTAAESRLTEFYGGSAQARKPVAERPAPDPAL